MKSIPIENLQNLKNMSKNSCIPILHDHRHLFETSALEDSVKKQNSAKFENLIGLIQQYMS